MTFFIFFIIFLVHFNRFNEKWFLLFNCLCLHHFLFIYLWVFFCFLDFICLNLFINCVHILMFLFNSLFFLYDWLWNSFGCVIYIDIIDCFFFFIIFLLLFKLLKLLIPSFLSIMKKTLTFYIRILASFNFN